MSDLINRQAAIDALSVDKEMLSRVLDDMDVVGTDREKYSWGLGLIESSIKDIEELPSEQPEQKKGNWEYHWNPNIRGGMNPEDAYCSACGFHIYTPDVYDFDDYNYCPRCGAEQRGEE